MRRRSRCVNCRSRCSHRSLTCDPSQIRLSLSCSMRIAFQLRLRRNLSLMQVKQPSPLASPSTSSSPSRPFTSTVAKQPSASPKRSSDSPAAEEPPAKVVKTGRSRNAHASSSSSMSHPERSHHSRSSRGAGSSLLAKAHHNNASGGRGRRNKQKEKPALPTFPGPVHNEQHVTNTYKAKPLKEIHETNPKSPLSNYLLANGQQMNFTANHGLVEGSDQQIWRSVFRCSVHVLALTCGPPPDVL